MENRWDVHQGQWWMGLSISCRSTGCGVLSKLAWSPSFTDKNWDKMRERGLNKRVMKVFHVQASCFSIRRTSEIKVHDAPKWNSTLDPEIRLGSNAGGWSVCRRTIWRRNALDWGNREAIQQAAKIVFPREYSLNCTKSFVENSLLEEGLAASLGLFSGTRIRVDIGNHAAIENSFTV